MILTWWSSVRNLKLKYNRLHTGMWALGDILQGKVDEMISDIEGFKTYIHDILVLTRDSLSKHIYQLRIIFGGLRTVGLNINDPQWRFGLKDINYLIYVITREGIKPDLNKLQVIIYIRRPTTTTEARSIIGMVQYYGDMCPIRSHTLAPLTESASGSKSRKIIWEDPLEDSFKELKRMVYYETLLSYPDWTIPLKVHTDASDKQLGAVIS